MIRPFLISVDMSIRVPLHFEPEATVNPVKIDRQLTFDRLTGVHYSGTRHPEDQPSHLVVHDASVCATRCREEYGNPCIRFCPANAPRAKTRFHPG